MSVEAVPETPSILTSFIEPNICMVEMSRSSIAFSQTCCRLPEKRAKTLAAPPHAKRIHFLFKKTFGGR